MRRCIVAEEEQRSPLIEDDFQVGCCRDVRGGAFSRGAGRGQKSAGRGEGENPRGGAKERVNQLIQKFDKCEYLELLWRYL